MTTLLTVLLVVSAVGEVFGTATVWWNYRAGTLLAIELLQDVETEDLQERAIEALHPGQRVLEQSDPGLASFRVTEAARELRRLRRRVGNHLGARWYVPAGLAALVVGAVSGLAAGLVAIYR